MSKPAKRTMKQILIGDLNDIIASCVEGNVNLGDLADQLESIRDTLIESKVIWKNE